MVFQQFYGGSRVGLAFLGSKTGKNRAGLTFFQQSLKPVNSKCIAEWQWSKVNKWDEKHRQE